MGINIRMWVTTTTGLGPNKAQAAPDKDPATGAAAETQETRILCKCTFNPGFDIGRDVSLLANDCSFVRKDEFIKYCNEKILPCHRGPRSPLLRIVSQIFFKSSLFLHF